MVRRHARAKKKGKLELIVKVLIIGKKTLALIEHSPVRI